MLQKIGLHPLDWAIIAIYLIAILGIGLLFWWLQKRKKHANSTKHFFTGGGKNPVWVVGISIFATITSSLFYLNTPGTVMGSRWAWIGSNIAIVAMIPVVIKWVIPFYRRMKESTAYSFLENRFHYSLRAVNSLSFIIFQVFRVAVVLYVPTLALSVIIDISPILILIIVGIVTVVITTIGGFKAVVWSDAIQGIVLLGGIVLVIIIGLARTNWGSDTLKYHQILDESSFKPTLVFPGIIMLAVYNTINSLYSFMGSQDVTQRYKGTKSVRQVRQTLWIMFWASIATMLLFFGAGSILYTYFSSQGYYVDNTVGSGINNIVGTEGSGPAFFSFFIAGSLPIGIVGLILSAIFAATQSTVSSGLSALSNSIVVDFIARFKPNLPDKTLSLISKALVLFFGVLGILFGIVLIATKQDDLFNYFTGFIGLLNAPTIAIFLLGIFTTRTNWKGALLGFTVATVVGICIWLPTQKFISPNGAVFSFSGAWLTLITFSVALGLGYLGSLILPAEQNDLTNRTYWTRSKEFIDLMNLEEELDKAEKRKDEKAILELQVQVNHLTKVVDSQGYQPKTLGI